MTASHRQTCARWECPAVGTYDKPLCYQHWREWEDGGLEECTRCHWFLQQVEFVMYDIGEWEVEAPLLCDPCLWDWAVDRGLPKPWSGPKLESRAPYHHAPIQRQTRYVYLLKLANGGFYAGQTTDLAVRLLEHRDGLQRQTRGENPVLVYFEKYDGGKSYVVDREKELIPDDGIGAGPACAAADGRGIPQRPQAPRPPCVDHTIAR